MDFPCEDVTIPCQTEKYIRENFGFVLDRFQADILELLEKYAWDGVHAACFVSFLLKKKHFRKIKLGDVEIDPDVLAKIGSFLEEREKVEKGFVEFFMERLEKSFFRRRDSRWLFTDIGIPGKIIVQL